MVHPGPSASIAGNKLSVRTTAEELNRRKATVYIHPIFAPCRPNIQPGVRTNLLEFPFDSMRNIASLLNSRTPSRSTNGPVLLEVPRPSLRAQCGYQRKGKGGSAGGGGAGTDDDCTADDCALGLGGLRGGTGTAGDGGRDDIFCLMSWSIACTVAMFWAICSCLAASCSKLRRMTARSRAMGSSCTNSGEVAAAVGADV